MIPSMVIPVGGRVSRVSIDGWIADVACAHPDAGVAVAGAARRLAEALVAASVGVAPDGVRVAALLPSGRPVAMSAAGPMPVSVSVSHERTIAGAAVSSATRVGIDIVDPLTVCSALDAWFRNDERSTMPQAESHCDDVTTEWRACLWSAKEAAYKAASLDVPFAPLAVAIVPGAGDRFHFTVQGSLRDVSGSGRCFTAGRHVVALAVVGSVVTEDGACS